MKFTTIILFLSISSAYAQEITIPIKELNVKKGEKIYLKKIDYFNYFKDDFVVDSLTVRSKFITFKKDSAQSLFLISKDKSVPNTYKPFREMPNIYYYMFCSRFYSKYDYLVLKESYNKKEHEFLEQFYKDFSNNSFDENLSDINGYKRMSVKEVEREIETRKTHFIEQIETSKKELSKELIEYLETEIELGAINQFLNWYEGTYMDKINAEFSSNNLSFVHEEYYKKFSKNKWNKNAVQYFRIILRLLNYGKSKENNEFKLYHEGLDTNTKKTQEIVKNTASNNGYK